MQHTLRETVRVEPPSLRELVDAIARGVRADAGHCYFVGGCVRDAALGRVASEVDLEVHGVDSDRLAALLEALHPCDRVGRAFQVFRFRGLPVDVSVPRREPAESRAATAGDARAGIEHAAARRDFTINSMAVDVQSGEWLDPFGGREDLRAGLLRHTSPRFVDDPLRVLRGMQLAGRFSLRAVPETLAICSQLSSEGLPLDRIFGEWQRLLVDAESPSMGLAFLQAAGWLRDHPELEALRGCPQDPRWHPEGDVWTHTLACLDAHARARSGDPTEDLVTGLAVLCHDFGKPATTRRDGERLSAHGHAERGVELTGQWLKRISARRDLAQQVVPLVRWHLSPAQLFRDGAGDAAIRRLAHRVGRLDRLLVVAKADHQGRGEAGEHPFEAGDWLRERASDLAVLHAAAPRLVRGDDLLALGATPGPALGRLLEECYQAQLDGLFANRADGLAHARRRIRETLG